MALRRLSVRALLLDALGTLVELEPPVPRLRRLAAERFGLEVSDETATRAFATEVAYYRARLGEGRDPASVADLRRRCAALLWDGLDPARPPARRPAAAEQTALLLDALVFAPFPEVAPILRELRAGGLRLVVASNWDASLPETLERHGLLALLDGVVTSAGCGAAKPSPAIFTAALAMAGVTAEAAVHVGDSLTEDVAGALAAGIRPVLVSRRSTTGPAPVGAPAEVPVIHSLDGLPALLARLGRD